MLIDRVRLQQFRNLGDLAFEPGPGLTFLIGPNGSGKTSSLEGISLVATLRSFRGGRPEDLLQRTTTAARVTLESREEDRCYEVHLRRISDDRVQKSASINGKIFGRTSDYLKQRLGPAHSGLHAIVFSPSQIELATGEPSLRREYLQSVLVAEDPLLIDVHRRYSRALEQRNAWLKEPLGGVWGGSDPFASEILMAGSKILHDRFCWLKRLAEKLPTVLSQIVESELDIVVGYKTSLLTKTGSWRQSEVIEINGLWTPPSIEIIHDSFQRSSHQALPAEKAVGSTLVGPHRDDWGFFIRGTELKRVASQGEIRAVILSLKLAELLLFQEKTAFSPLLLVDDFSSELDAHRRGRLLSHLVASRVQTLVTATESPGQGFKTFHLSQGRLL